MEASAWSVAGLVGAGAVSGTGVVVSVLMTGSSLIPYALVETTDSARVLVLFRLKPAHVLGTPSGVGVVPAAGLRPSSFEGHVLLGTASGVGEVFFAAGLRSSSFKGLSLESLIARRSCLFLGRFVVRSLPVELAFRLLRTPSVSGMRATSLREVGGADV
jgi:hypothetical protein